MGEVVISGIHQSTHSTVCLIFYIQRHVMSLTTFKDNQHNRKVEISAQSGTFILHTFDCIRIDCLREKV